MPDFRKLATCAAVTAAVVAYFPAVAQAQALTPPQATGTAPAQPPAPGPSSPMPAVNTKAPAAPSFFLSQDNSIGYRVGTEFKESAIRNPANPNGTPITKHIVTLTHVDAWKYGSNFLNLDILKSDHSDPANKTSTGAVELYFIYRGQLSPDAIFGTKVFPSGPIRDITFEAGFDRNTKNTKFGGRSGWSWPGRTSTSTCRAS